MARVKCFTGFLPDKPLHPPPTLGLGITKSNSQACCPTQQQQQQPAPLPPNEKILIVPMSRAAMLGWSIAGEGRFRFNFQSRAMPSGLTVVALSAEG